jgi:hypothetical protein
MTFYSLFLFSPRNLIRQLKIHPLTGVSDIVGTLFVDERQVSIKLEEPAERLVTHPNRLYINIFIEQKRNGADLMLLRKIIELLNNKDILFPLPNGRKHRALILAQNIEEAQKLKCTMIVKLLGIKEKAAIYFSKFKHKKMDTERFFSKSGPERILIVVEGIKDYFDMPEVSGKISDIVG